MHSVLLFKTNVEDYAKCGVNTDLRRMITDALFARAEQVCTVWYNVVLSFTILLMVCCTNYFTLVIYNLNQ